MNAYRDRKPILLADGTHCFQDDEDRQEEAGIARLVEEQTARVCIDRCGWEIRHFAELSQIDWYAVHYKRVIGLLELKGRDHSSGKYRTVFLNAHKYWALLHGSKGFGVPALFVVRFSDQVRWSALRDIDPRNLTFGGGQKAEPGPNDFEPVIEVPVGQMHRLEELGCER
jgi:hypothetical protein